MNDTDNNHASDSDAVWRKALLSQRQHDALFDDRDLGLFRWYIRETDELIARMEADSPCGPDDDDVFAVNYFARRVRYSHVIHLASVLESIMRQACEKLRAGLGQNLIFELKDLKGDQWSTKKTFLQRCGHFEIDSGLWKPVQHLLSVRNVLVHRNGWVDSMKPKEKTAIARPDGIEIMEEELDISTEYVQSTLAAIEKLSEFLDQEVGQVLESAVRPRVVK